jgi:hypothetical protein
MIVISVADSGVGEADVTNLPSSFWKHSETATKHYLMSCPSVKDFISLANI